MSELVLKTLEDRVLTLTLNRPEALNAWNAELHAATIAAFDEADRDDAVRVVILTGAGRAFCAGADLAGGGRIFDHRDETIDEHRDTGAELALHIYDSRKPVIAAINGPATGVGITMTLPCDVRLASSKAKMGFVFARRGIAPDACSSWFAPRVVGISRAAEWFLTGRVFDAAEALEARLVSEVLEPEALLPRAREIARMIAEHTSAVSVAATRRLIWRMLGATGPRDAFGLESKVLWYLGGAADAREGVASFVEKRRPEFTLSVSKDFPDFLE
jgi:enoyl-CoA hydratase/carnithine racemase